MSEYDVMIRVEGLGKKYTIKHDQTERYRTIKDSIAHRSASFARWVNPFTLGGQIRQSRRRSAQDRSRCQEDFWALKDVSFEIRRGERVGIIGRNGAGKSTLLKILSRITEPTTGRVEIRGRVASLLEVGTGFHPELTGRENIYLNGAILGMTRREIRSKYDAIVEFAEVEKFLDTPVKRYSSGMYVRLAFVVAAHLEPEILVVDEVLAVGDASFQKKCLGKMEDVADKEGRTVLFVSHQMSAIKTLCNKAIVIMGGSVQYMGSVSGGLSCYLESIEPSNASLSTARRKASLGSNFRFTHYELNILDPDILCLQIRAEISLRVSKSCIISVGFCSLSGELLFNCPFVWEPPASCIQSEDEAVFSLKFPKLPLTEGTYCLNFFCEQAGQTLDQLSAAAYVVIPSSPRITSSNPRILSRRKGVVIDYNWKCLSGGVITL